jgi:hypothetical protein
VDSAWFHRFWVDLDRHGRSVLAQVHTHARSAFHSQTDDEGAIVHVPGFVSLVLPEFAMRNDPLDGSYVARLDGAGKFIKSTREAEMRLLP